MNPAASPAQPSLCHAAPPPTGEPLIYPHERVDDLQLNGLRLIQNPRHFCFGIDAVMLSDFAKVRKNETVLDLCSGSGIIPILLTAKTNGRYFTGLELMPEMADMAQRSVILNHLQERVSIEEGDIKQAAERYGFAAFDVITVNPPYMNSGGGLLNASEAQAMARHEIACTLTDVIAVSARLLKYGGRLYMVHRPHRLAEIFEILRQHRMEPKTLRMVQATVSKPPSLALIEAAQDGRPWLNVMPALILSGET